MKSTRAENRENTSFWGRLKVDRGKLCRASVVAGIIFVFMAIAVRWGMPVHAAEGQSTSRDDTAANAVQLVAQGRQVFRFNTFGDEAFWGDTLKLHQAIEGAGLGGVGPGVSPKTALTV